MKLLPANKTRACRLAAMLRGYGTDDTDRGCVIDLLTDARHWCDCLGESYAACDRIAYDHYLAEIGDPEEAP
jgi:hypothetical protein